LPEIELDYLTLAQLQHIEYKSIIYINRLIRWSRFVRSKIITF